MRAFQNSIQMLKDDIQASNCNNRALENGSQASENKRTQALGGSTRAKLPKVCFE